MADTRGVFRLDRVRTRSVKGTWVTPDEAFFAGSTESPNVGYYGGGQNPSQSPAIVSTVDKTNFATDSTAVAPASSLTVNHQVLGSLSSISAGYLVEVETPQVQVHHLKYKRFHTLVKLYQFHLDPI